MSKQTKSSISKSVLFDTQYEVCDVIYRKLYELMYSVFRLDIRIEMEDLGQFKLHITETGDDMLNFSHMSQGGGTDNNGYVPLKNINKKIIECPFMTFLCRKSNLNNSRPELYTKWISEIKKVMQNLLDEENKYKAIIDDIREIPMFSPTRQVLIEKI